MHDLHQGVHKIMPHFLSILGVVDYQCSVLQVLSSPSHAPSICTIACACNRLYLPFTGRDEVFESGLFRPEACDQDG
jgi:hypothetical protein